MQLEEMVKEWTKTKSLSMAYDICQALANAIEIIDEIKYS